MSEIFKYPDATSPTKTLTFETASGGTGRHLASDDAGIEFHQESDRTVGGTLLVDSLAAPTEVFELTYLIQYSSGSYTDWADVLSFFGASYANGGVNTFVWTDHESTQRTVLLRNGTIHREMFDSEKCWVTFQVEVVS